MNSTPDNAAPLVLVPTRLELDFVKKYWPHALHDQLRVCGFGPVAAAARTTDFIHQFRPRQIILLGIAGSYRVHLEPGQSIEFDEVACHGVGVGEGQHFRSAASLKWDIGQDQRRPIGETIRLKQIEAGDDGSDSGERHLLLTATSAAGNQQDVDTRLQQFPTAVAEDMEGFGVALACFFNDIPLRIVRGISNRAGDRDHSNWLIDEAIRAAVTRALQPAASSNRLT